MDSEDEMSTSCARRGRARLLGFVVLGLVAAAAILAATPTPGYALGGAAVSWGENYHGQLGTFYRDGREESPVAVEGLNNIVVTADSIALLSDGTVASWGGNQYGQLGNGGFKATWELGKSHVAVSGLTKVKAISNANEHSLALLEDGTVKAWGNNQYGQLGNGTGGFEEETKENQRIPKTVQGLTGVKAIASGGGSNYALLSNGTVMAWGSNTKGQLGIEWPVECQAHNTPGCEQLECRTETGRELCSTRPHTVVMANNTPLKEVIAIAASQDAGYALLKSGVVMSWGGNGRGELGQGETAKKFVPPGSVVTTTNEPVKSVSEIDAGYDHVLIRLKNGKVMGWGDAEKGALGKEPKTAECGKALCFKRAKTIAGLPKQVQQVVGGGHFSLVLSQHSVYSFGRNEDGELGNGTTITSPTPAVVPGLSHVAFISAADKHAFAVLEAGTPTPAPLVTLEPEEGALKLEWASNNAERLVYREFERPGVTETEEEAGEPGGGEEGGTGSPQNTTRPRVKGEAREGQTLQATTGNWVGAEPIVFEYQWQRCNGLGECVSIAGANAATYEVTAADVKDILRIVITARNSVEPPGTAISEPTEIVRSEEEGRKSPAQSVKLTEGQHSIVVDELNGKTPLAAVPHELKFKAAKRIRTMIGTPLP
jgi:alpha-tubulin suppressor-like RCC1 family protein